jgi:carboxymethylenebutenolidase
LGAGEGGAISLPPAEGGAKAALEGSPRHGEWVDVANGAGPAIRSWVVYPEVKEKAPVVIVIHEIFGESDWIRAVTDRLAAEGFIAIAPDLLSGYGPKGGGMDEISADGGGRDAVVKAIRKLSAEDVNGRLDAVRNFALKLPAATEKVGTVGFCWGGGMSFSYAIHQPGLNAAVVYYGSNPKDAAELGNIGAAVQGHFGGKDARVTSTVAPCQELMKKAGKVYEAHVYEGAGHGFLRQQEGQEGANMRAAEEAWKSTVAFLRERLK